MECQLIHLFILNLYLLVSPRRQKFRVAGMNKATEIAPSHKSLTLTMIPLDDPIPQKPTYGDLRFHANEIKNNQQQKLDPAKQVSKVEDKAS